MPTKRSDPWGSRNSQHRFRQRWALLCVKYSVYPIDSPTLYRTRGPGQCRRCLATHTDGYRTARPDHEDGGMMGIVNAA